MSPDYQGLDGWRATGVGTVGDADLRVAAEVAERLATCHRCGTIGRLVRLGTRSRVLRDVLRGDARVGIAFKHQRYRCNACRGLSYDPLPGMDSARNMTARLVSYIERLVLTDRFTHVADAVGLGEKTIRSIFRD